MSDLDGTIEALRGRMQGERALLDGITNIARQISNADVQNLNPDVRTSFGRMLRVLAQRLDGDLP